MDLNKVGTFIANLRKEKDLTQAKLGEMLGVNDKTVSRWETGKNAPDISILNDLSEKLDISVKELLNGERNLEKDINIEALKYYNNRGKKRILISAIIAVLIILLLSILFFSINKYNQYKVFKVYSSNSNLNLEGIVVLNPYRNIIVLRNIEYSDYNEGTTDEISSKSYYVKLLSNDKIIKNEIYNFDKEMTLRDFLETYTLYVDESLKNSEDLILLDNLILYIEYKENDKIQDISFDLYLVESK